MNTVAAKVERESQQRRFVMTRKNSHQKGNLQWHRENWTVRYWELNHQTKEWKLRRERLDGYDDPNKKKAARKAADDFIATVNERNNNPKVPKLRKEDSEITFKQFVEGRWKAYTITARHQVSTLDQRSSLIKKRLLPFFGEKKLKEIKRADISDFLEDLYGKLSQHTLQNLYGLLRSMFSVAVDYELIKKSPVKQKIHKPEMMKVEKPTLKAAQIRAILAGLPDDQERLFALLLAVTGMRIGECLALRWMDFEAKACELSINHTLFRQKLKQPKTKSSKSSIRLAPSIAGLLALHKEQSSFQADDDYIFCRLDGRSLNPTALRNHLYSAMDSLKDDLKIKRVKGQYGYHIFRHSAGSIVYKKSRDLKMVQGTLRHADISTTSDIYIHLDDEVLGEGSEILTKEIYGDCDPVVTQESRLVS